MDPQVYGPDPHQSLGKWGLECTTSKELFESILPVGDNSINVENVERVATLLEGFFEKYEDYFNCDDIPALKGLAQILSEVEPQRWVRVSSSKRVCLRGKCLDEEDWSIKIAALMDKIRAIASKHLPHKELREFGDRLFPPVIWGVVGMYDQQSVESIKGPVDKSAFLNLASDIAKKLTSSQEFSEEDLEKIRVSYRDASPNDRHLFCRTIEKHLMKNNYIPSLNNMALNASLLGAMTTNYTSDAPLDLTGCPLLISRFAFDLRKLNNIKVLNLSASRRVFANLMSLPKSLEKLNLSNEGWRRPSSLERSPSSPETVLGVVFSSDAFPHLKILDLRNNSTLTEEIINLIKEKLPNTRVLSDFEEDGGEAQLNDGGESKVDV